MNLQGFDFIFRKLAAMPARLAACTDVELLKRLVGIIFEGLLMVILCEEFRPSREIYDGNADEYFQEITTLCAEMRDRIEPIYETLLTQVAALSTPST
jgi:hypothetical protein